MNTTTINGLTVLAKPDNSPLTYGNLTAAQKKADSLSSLTESWEGRKVEGYRFCVVLASRLTRVETEQVHGAPPFDLNPDYGEGPDGMFDEDGFQIHMKAENLFPTIDESSLVRIDYSAQNREFVQSYSSSVIREALKSLKAELEAYRDRQLFKEASRIIESLRGIHSMDVIRFSPRSGSSAGKYTMRTLPRYGDNRPIQLPISREHVSLLVRAGFIRPGKRNRWKFVPEKLRQSLRYLGK